MGAESQGDPENSRIPPPPVEPALCHRGPPTVAGEGWGARSRDLAAAAGPGHPEIAC